MKIRNWLEEGKKVPEFQSSGWAFATRIAGGFFFLCSFIFFIAAGTKFKTDSHFLYMLMAYGIGAGILAFIKAFLIDKLSEMSFYSKLSAEYLFELKNNQNKKVKDSEIK